MFRPRAILVASIPAMVVAVAFMAANAVPAWELNLPKARGDVPSKKQTFGWPFVSHWTEWETSNYPMYYGDGCTWEKPFVQPEWRIWGDDENAEASAYNRLIGIAAVFGTWMLAAWLYASQGNGGRKSDETTSGNDEIGG